MSQYLLQQEFNELSNEQKIEKGREIAQSLTLGKKFDEQEIVVLPDDLQSFRFFGMDISPFPTESRKIMKYIPTAALTKVLDSKHFYQVDKKYSVVFVNFEDLSYHNFENILNLDYLFDDVNFNLDLIQVKSDFVSDFVMSGSMDTLNSLDSLNYYTVPLNNSQRGGKRLIFHSNKLSYALTKMIKNSEFLDKKNFSHVNNVFRLNKFAPGDQKFKSHYDTPFADPQKDLYSKYTMIIYLTGNLSPENDNSTFEKDNSSYEKKECTHLPPLRIEDINFEEISPNQCIIFNQSCEHEGHAYHNNDKLFIRTELIFRIKDFQFDPTIAKMFNMACYMTKEPEQQQYSADLFNSCVKLRYNKEKEKIPRVYLMKSNFSTTYITDGNYYWFPKSVGLKSMAMLVILDYFNGRQYEIENIKIQSKALPRLRNKDGQEIEITDEYLFEIIGITHFEKKQDLNHKLKRFQEVDNLIPDSLCDDLTLSECRCHLGGGIITLFNYFEVQKKQTAEKVKQILDKTTVLIFDNKITINYDNIHVQYDKKNGDIAESGRIRLSDFYIQTQNKINFASCNCYDERIDHAEKHVLFKTKNIHTFCLPDIQFQEHPNGFKLSIDIFNNGFVYQSSNLFQQPFADGNKWAEIDQKIRQIVQQNILKGNYYDINFDLQEFTSDNSHEFFENESKEGRNYSFEEFEDDSEENDRNNVKLPPYKKIP